MPDDTGLEGRVAIVTGGAQGLGRATAHALADAGARVAVADIQHDKAAVVAAELGARGLAVDVDVADPDSCRRMVETCVERWGAVHVLVNNAAIFSTITMKPFEEITPDEWRRVLDVNLSGKFFCAQAVAGPMRRHGAGRIINLSSSTVLFGRPNYAHYVSSNAGVVGLTRALARELGPSGITVNTVMPGMTLTEIPRGTVTPEQARQAVAQQAIPQPMEPRDIAEAIVFLSSDSARRITGQTVVVDGGYGFV